MIVVSFDDTFHVRFQNILVDYSLGETQVGNKLWTNLNKASLRLWQTQLNFVVFCAMSACRVSSEHLNYKKHLMVRSLYRFQFYYRMRRILKRLWVPLPQEGCFNTANNTYTKNEFFKICKDYEAPPDPMRYRDEKFYWTYQQGVKWLDNFII